jgi:hypothetical protein
MLNISGGRLAQVQYLSGSFQVVSPGDHVVCAVTGRRIGLNELRYWSHEVQEAYADAQAAAKRYAQLRATGRLG